MSFVMCSTPLQSRAWTGLLLDSPRSPTDEEVLRQVLGEDARVVVINESVTTEGAIRRLMQAGATNILTIANHDQARLFAPILHVARSLASFKRIVLLYESESDIGVLFGHDGVLYLRDCPQVRGTLKELVARDTAPDFTFDSPVIHEPRETASL